VTAVPLCAGNIACQYLFGVETDFIRINTDQSAQGYNFNMFNQTGNAITQAYRQAQIDE